MEEMKYEGIKKAEFCLRKNRFICEILIDGKREICHVKNTGRLSELLVPGADVYVQESGNPLRKTKYDLISVKKDGTIVNIDSYAPNIAVGEYLKRMYPEAKVCPEKNYGSSRFDFYIENGDEKLFIEVKGVTLFRDGYALFPDAPTERGIKHLRELCDCVQKGYGAKAFFVIAANTEGKLRFSPNRALGDDFAKALCSAARGGVEICAFDCRVDECSMEVKERIWVELPTDL